MDMANLYFGEKPKIIDEEVLLTHEVCMEKSKNMSYESDDTSGIDTNKNFI